MGRQKSLIKVEGTLGDLTFFKSSEDGYLVREKGGVDGNRIKTDPRYERTRENLAEFGRAGAASKLFRQALSQFVKKSGDRRVTSRLTKEMTRVIQSDETNPRGLRNVIDGEAELLSGFEFNANAVLSTVVATPFTSTIDRATGQCSVAFPEFVPTDAINAPGGASHFKLNAVALEMDFESGKYDVKQASSADIALSSTPQAAIVLANSLPANSTKPLFLLVGIEFYQRVNNQMYSIRDVSKNAFTIVAVDGGV